MTNYKKDALKIIGVFILTLILVLTSENFFKFFTKETAAEIAKSHVTSTDENTENNDNSKIEEENLSPYERAKADFAENGMKGIWISYLEMQNMNFSSEEGFKSDIDRIFENCKNMGLNTVIVQVRAFGDAFYPSALFPYSHVITGRQGIAPNFDPLAVMVNSAHEKGLRFEAWINPYRVKMNGVPTTLAESNPANDESLVLYTENGIFYNPANEKAQDLIVTGVEEVVKNYPVDGVHFDDYFYPTADLTLDRRDYVRAAVTISPEDWRRENVNNLIKKVYGKIKEINPEVTFGISPQGNNDNNYNIQFSDVGLWLAGGYADYIMPQLYWGFDYKTADGGHNYAFKNILNQWRSMEKDSTVKMYIGLGAYRIGDGDGGANSQEEWQTGDNLARMIAACKEEKRISGYCIYRYGSLFDNDGYADLKAAEVATITKENMS